MTGPMQTQAYGSITSSSKFTGWIESKCSWTCTRGRERTGILSYTKRMRRYLPLRRTLRGRSNRTVRNQTLSRPGNWPLYGILIYQNHRLQCWSFTGTINSLQNLSGAYLTAITAALTTSVASPRTLWRIFGFWDDRPSRSPRFMDGPHLQGA